MARDLKLVRVIKDLTYFRVMLFWEIPYQLKSPHQLSFHLLTCTRLVFFSSTYLTSLTVAPGSILPTGCSVILSLLPRVLS